MSPSRLNPLRVVVVQLRLCVLAAFGALLCLPAGAALEPANWSVVNYDSGVRRGYYVHDVGPDGKTGGYRWMSGDTARQIRAWEAKGTTFANGSIRARDAITVAGRAGPMAVDMVVDVTARNAARAAARCLLFANLWCAAGAAAAAAIYDHYRVKDPANVPGSMVGPGSLDFDPGQESIIVEGYISCIGTDPNNCAKSATLEGLGPLLANIYRNGVANPTCPYVGGATTTQSWVNGYRLEPDENGVLRCSRTPVTVFSGMVARTKVPSCGPSVDFYDPKYSIPAGAAPGPDGKCPTARSNHTGMTPDDAGDYWHDHPPPGGHPWPVPGLTDAAGPGIDNAPDGMGTPGNVGASGPGNQTGGSKTTTRTTSSGTTTVQQTNTYNYTYNGTDITYNTTTTTVTVDENGNTSTEVEGPDPNKPPDPEDPCKARPNSVGCVELGSPSDTPIPAQTKQVDWHAEDLGFGGSCPAPYTFRVRGWELRLDYQVACDVAPIVRTGLLALVGLGCLLFLTANVRR